MNDNRSSKDPYIDTTAGKAVIPPISINFTQTPTALSGRQNDGMLSGTRSVKNFKIPQKIKSEQIPSRGSKL